MNESAEPVLEVLHQEDKHRYILSLDGQKVGVAKYVAIDDKRIFVHTETAPEISGRGLGVKLACSALSDTRASGIKIVPVCPFVAALVKRHHEFDSFVESVTPELINQVKNLQSS